MIEQQIFDTFVQIINWVSERNKTPKSYGTKDKLYIAEIHTLVTIGEHPGILQKDLCEKIGITKGRMSIIIAHLQEKDLIEMHHEESIGRTIPLYLSTHGELVFHNHNEQETDMKNKIHTVLSRCSPEEIAKFNKILQDVLLILK